MSTCNLNCFHFIYFSHRTLFPCCEIFYRRRMSVIILLFQKADSSSARAIQDWHLSCFSLVIKCMIVMKKQSLTIDACIHRWAWQTSMWYSSTVDVIFVCLIKDPCLITTPQCGWTITHYTMSLNGTGWLLKLVDQVLNLSKRCPVFVNT